MPGSSLGSTIGQVALSTSFRSLSLNVLTWKVNNNTAGRVDKRNQVRGHIWQLLSQCISYKEPDKWGGCSYSFCDYLDPNPTLDV